jgi:hypothetical protein
MNCLHKLLSLGLALCTLGSLALATATEAKADGIYRPYYSHSYRFYNPYGIRIPYAYRMPRYRSYGRYPYRRVRRSGYSHGYNWLGRHYDTLGQVKQDIDLALKFNGR